MSWSVRNQRPRYASGGALLNDRSRSVICSGVGKHWIPIRTPNGRSKAPNCIFTAPVLSHFHAVKLNEAAWPCRMESWAKWMSHALFVERGEAI